MYISKADCKHRKKLTTYMMCMIGDWSSFEKVGPLLRSLSEQASLVPVDSGVALCNSNDFSITAMQQEKVGAHIP